MIETRDAEPPRALLDLARLATKGDVSNRHHAASRARLLNHDTTPKKSTTWAIAGVVGIMAIGTSSFATAMAVKRMPTHETHPAPTPSVWLSPPDSDDKSDTESAADSEQATFTISVAPAYADIYWDDERLPGNPAQLTRQPDGKVHRVRAQAGGYASKTQNVMFNGGNMTVSFELQALPAEIGPMSVSGTVPGADAAIEGLRQRFRDCYEEGLSHDHGLQGSAVVSVKIGGDGRVTSSHVEEVKGLSPKVTTCLAYVVTDLTFDNFEKPATLRVPIAFRAMP